MIVNIRKAALALHNVSAKDKTWIMARLPEGVRHEIGNCISELDQLGISATEMAGVDLSRINSITHGEHTPFDLALQKSLHVSLVGRIEAYPLPILLDWINTEVEWLAAQVMQLLNDSRILRALEEIQIDKATRIRKLMRDTKALPPSVGDNLLGHLANELSEMSQARQGRLTSFPDAPQGSRIRIRERFSKWFRSFDQRK